MEQLGDVAHVESHSVHLETVLVLSNIGAWFASNYHRLRNCFGRTRWYSYVTRLKWKLISFVLEIVLILTQDRCTVCAKRTIGSEIVLDASDGTLRWRGSWRILFWSSYCRCKIGPRFAPNLPQAWKSFWTKPMELLGDVAHVEARFGPFGDSAHLNTR
jgi:hypothetical protein